MGEFICSTQKQKRIRVQNISKKCTQCDKKWQVLQHKGNSIPIKTLKDNQITSNQKVNK